MEGVGAPWFHDLPIAAWYRRHYLWALQAGASECTQRAGDVLYVPGHWHHAVFNVDTSVGLTQQVGNVKDFLQHVRAFVRESSRKKSDVDLSAAD